MRELWMNGLWIVGISGGYWMLRAAVKAACRSYLRRSVS